MTPADDPTQLLADMRARLESSTAEIDDLAASLATTRGLADDLETLVDVLLGLDGSRVIVIDDDRRIRGLSRAAAELDGAAVGKPLSSAVPDELFDEVVERLDTDSPRTTRPMACAGADVYRLPGGGAVLVLAP
jgi:hypothetical protein